MEENIKLEEYRKRMDHFPCAFNLIGADKVSTAKLKAIRHNLTSELDINDGCENERIIKRNLLTWVQFRLEKRDEALQLNNEVIESTKRENIASLANRLFIMWQTGDEIEALNCLKDLEKMTSEENFQTQLSDAQAEQAYYYSRLGGPNNLQRAIDIYCALPETPINYLRRFGLGLVYRRMTHLNIVCSSSQPLTVADYQKMAAECLFEVAENADGKLSSQAYAQLVALRRCFPFQLTPDDKKMFHGLSVEQLCQNALIHGENIPAVLVCCGKALKPLNIDKSIELLEKSIRIKEDTTAYHHLGICYIRKAENTRNKYAYNRSRSDGPSHRSYKKVQGASGYRFHDANSRYTRVSVQNIDDTCRIAQDACLTQGNTQTVCCDVPNKKTPLSGQNWSVKISLGSSVRRCKNYLLLNKDDKNVQEARKCFEKAIELASENLPAVLDLGILLKNTNQIQDALKQFNNITNSCNPVMYSVIVISAYEQAGLCYLQLHESEGKDDYLEMGKSKLTKAVGIAADLIHTMPELQGSHEDVWQAFSTLITKIDEEQIPDKHRQEKKIRVLELAKEHGSIIDVIQKLKDTQHENLTDPFIVKTALDSYLQRGENDNALTHLNIVAMNRLVKDSDWWKHDPMLSLRVKVLLRVISGYLKNRDENPIGLFRQLFELILGSCVGLRDPENDQQTDSATSVSGDVLFVFESDDSPSEETFYPTVKSARCLMKLSACLFGLEVTENLKGTGEFGGDQATIQLKEMLKYQVVIIVLGNEERDPIFNAILERVSYNSAKAPSNQKILVINTGTEDDNIPSCLKQYKSLKLKDLGILDDPQRIPSSWNDTDPIPYTDIMRDVFDEDVDAVLKLFCFMIEQTWPCS